MDGDEDYEHRCEVCSNTPMIVPYGLCEQCLYDEDQQAA